MRNHPETDEAELMVQAITALTAHAAACGYDAAAAIKSLVRDFELAASLDPADAAQGLREMIADYRNSTSIQEGV